MKPNTLTGNADLVQPDFNRPPNNPLHLLQQWLDIAGELKIVEPRGLVLSTISRQGQPSSRVVLLKTVDDAGVTFASSEMSQKGVDISENPAVAGTLWWRETVQQVNFCGVAVQLPAEESDALFRERAREAQVVANVSVQSAVMNDETALRDAVDEKVGLPGEIARPSTWHGYRIYINAVEFWHGRPDRFHNRLHYDLQNKVWKHQKLQP